MKITPIILAGGNGKRLWPLSRRLYPKQFLALKGEETLLQSTAERVSSDFFEKPTIICQEDHRFLVSDQLLAIGVTPSHLIIEPCARNTAPAIAAACLAQENPDALVLVLPSDHFIAEPHYFQALVKEAEPFALKGHVVLFGISPQNPSTDYGYIKASALIGEGSPLLKVEAFTEKPSKEKAEALLKKGGYFWNSGIFFAKASTLIEEIQKFSPELFELVSRAVTGARKDLNFLRLDAESYEACENISIDYAVMEKSQKTCLMPAKMDWSDLGSWKSLYDLSQKDQDQNVFLGDVIACDVKKSYVHSQGLLVSLLGVEDVIVVASPDAILITSQQQAHKIKNITDQLDVNRSALLDSHSKVHRPWGYYQVIDLEERFQVKRIMVKPGHETSIQIHHHRSEHWVIVSGTAKVLRGTETLLVHENESVYLPMGMQHRISNPGKIDLHLIEVQTGSYLGEDDIVRLEDPYGRPT